VATLRTVTYLSLTLIGAIWRIRLNDPAAMRPVASVTVASNSLLLQTQLLDPIMVKYEHDVTATSDSDVIAPADSHVTSSAPSPFADFAAPEVRPL